MDNKAMYKLTYGLFVVTAKMGDKISGCITNTAIQAASSPNQISLAVNKANYTHDMIMESGKFNVSVISRGSDLKVVGEAENVSLAVRALNSLLVLINKGETLSYIREGSGNLTPSTLRR